jgi:hypothetical protein
MAERGLQRHRRTENDFIQNDLLGLPTWCIMKPDAYRQHIPKGEGKGAGLQDVQGDPNTGCL